MNSPVEAAGVIRFHDFKPDELRRIAGSLWMLADALERADVATVQADLFLSLNPAPAGPAGIPKS